MKVKKGDTVVVIAGKDKGSRGKVLSAIPREDKVVVEASTGSRSTPASAPPSGARRPAAS